MKALSGHRSLIPPRIGQRKQRVSDEILQRISTFPAADIGDRVGAFYIMAPHIRPLYAPMPRICGRALTVKAWPGDNLSIHGALSACVEKDDILVIDWRGYTAACGSGGNALVHGFSQGLRGVVIDGAWRDIDELRECGFPVFGTAISTFSPTKSQPGEINVTIQCGGVVVEPGDLIVADNDGVVVVPSMYAAKVAESLERDCTGAEKTDQEQAAATAAKADRFLQVFRDLGGVDEREV